MVRLARDVKRQKQVLTVNVPILTASILSNKVTLFHQGGLAFEGMGRSLGGDQAGVGRNFPTYTLRLACNLNGRAAYYTLVHLPQTWEVA